MYPSYLFASETERGMVPVKNDRARADCARTLYARSTDKRGYASIANRINSRLQATCNYNQAQRLKANRRARERNSTDDPNEIS